MNMLRDSKNGFLRDSGRAVPIILSSGVVRTPPPPQTYINPLEGRG